MSSEIVWRWASPRIGRGEIAKVEGQWGIRLPDDYIECALHNHGGSPSRNILNITDRRDVVLSHLLSYVDRTGPGQNPSIRQTFTSIRDRLPDRVFPFAADPFGNYLCFDFRKRKTRNPVIVFWNHEAAFDDSERALTPVCLTFSELLSLLYEG